MSIHSLRRTRPHAATTLVFSLLASCVTGDSINNAGGSISMPSYPVPTFTLEELRPEVTSDRLRDVLGSTGLLAIRVPVHEDVNLQGLCGCDLGSHIPNGDRVTLAGGVNRATIATATMGTEQPMSLPREDIERACGAGANHNNNSNNNSNNSADTNIYDKLEDARDVVSRAVTMAFLPALDQLHRKHDDDVILRSKGQQKNGYNTVSSIVEDQESVHLEHFHVYSKEENRKQDSARATMDWHTDAGLFLAFLPGQKCQDSTSSSVMSSDDSFRVRVPSSDSEIITEKIAVFPQANNGEVVVAIMLGTGAEHWLKMPTEDNKLKLRATQHAVQMRGGDRRVWYGMMFLVPPKAIVQTSPNELTFAEMRNSVSVHSASRRFGDESTSSPSVSVGCGNKSTIDHTQRKLYMGRGKGGYHHSKSYRGGYDHLEKNRRGRVQHGVDPKDCSNSVKGVDFYCWMQCPLVTNEDNKSVRQHLEKGESVYCVNLGVLAETRDVKKALDACTDEKRVVGGVMDAGCANVWHKTVQGAFSYLDNESVIEQNTEKLYGEKYCYGTTSMYMQGFEWEGTTCLVYLFKSWVITSRMGFLLACLGTIAFGVVVELVMKYRKLIVGGMSASNPKKKMASSALTYGVQLTLGYMLMLVVMTYSGPLVMCCVIGLMVGHVVCHWEALSSGEKRNTRKDNTSNGNNNNTVDLFSASGTTPCCLAPPSETTKLKDAGSAEPLATDYSTGSSRLEDGISEVETEDVECNC